MQRDRVVDHLLRGRNIGEVQAQVRSSGKLALRRAPRDPEHLHPLSRQCDCRGPANTRARARDDGDMS